MTTLEIIPLTSSQISCSTCYRQQQQQQLIGYWFFNAASLSLQPPFDSSAFSYVLLYFAAVSITL